MSHVRLTYDGPALAAHTMDVRLLAPALLAFGNLCEHAAHALYGDAVRVRVEVKASFSWNVERRSNFWNKATLVVSVRLHEFVEAE